MAVRVRVRRLSDEEGRQLQQMVRRGHGKSATRYRRAMVVLASASGNNVEVIARLVQTGPDRVREVIHRIRIGLWCLDPQWAGGRPRRVTIDDEIFLVEAAGTRPEQFGLPFTRWSVRKFTECLNDKETHRVVISRERVRQLLGEHGITFQRTKTWKEFNHPDRDAKLDRIEQVIDEHPERTFAFDEFGPLAIRPTGGSAWAPAGEPPRQPANYNKLPGVRQFHGCYSIGDDTLWGVVRYRKSGTNTLAGLRSIRAARPDGERIYVILDNLSA
jgi:transposase